MGSFSTIGGGITKLSQLEIDVDKDWGGKGLIYANLRGAALVRYLDVDHDLKLGAPPLELPYPKLKLLTPDITMSPLEYYEWDTTIGYGPPPDYPLMLTLVVGNYTPGSFIGHLTDSAFGDVNFRCLIFVPTEDGLVVRFQSIGPLNAYWFPLIDTYQHTMDHIMYKWLNSVGYWLAYEAVDLPANSLIDGVASAIGSTLKSSRNGGSTFPITATDTSFANGRWGFYLPDTGAQFTPISFGSPPPPSAPRCIGYYEVPITGSGKRGDPRRPALPELLEAPTQGELDGYPKTLRDAIKCNRDGLVNRLALTVSALYPSRSGDTCIVRVFEQPDRQPHIWKIPEVLRHLETQKAIPVRKLDVDQAIRRAKEMDPKLSDFDLYDIPSPSDEEIRKYIRWREERFGAKMSMEVARGYLESKKGWS